MYNSEIEDYFDLQEDSELDKKEMELKKSILLQKKLKRESFLNTGCLIKDNNNDNFNIELLKGCDFNFFFLKKIINLNFTFLLFYKNLYYDYFLKNNEVKNLNLFYFFNKTCESENYLIFLKKKNIFFFNDLNLDVFNVVKDYNEKNLFFFNSKKRAFKIFSDNLKKNSKESLNFYNYFFKKKNILKKKFKFKSYKSKFVNCKKFFKSKKLEIIKYLRDVYFKKRVNKRYVSIFIKKLKKKSTLAISYSLSTSFFNILSVFFFFLNLNYIKFLLKKKYFYINFKSIEIKKNSFNFGSFFSCVFFSQIFNIFFFFKLKIDKYLSLLSRKIKKPKFSKIKLINSLKNKNLNLLNYLNTFNFTNAKLIEVDYLTLSFFFFGNGSSSLTSNFGFNIFLHRLLLFK